MDKGGASLASSATNAQLAATGGALGVFHVLTGPDHLTAIAAIAAGGRWRAFPLGLRWGFGHSTGLLAMTAVFLLGDVSLEALAPKCEAVVGVFMVALGCGTAARLLLGEGACADHDHGAHGARAERVCTWHVSGQVTASVCACPRDLRHCSMPSHIMHVVVTWRSRVAHVVATWWPHMVAPW